MTKGTQESIKTWATVAGVVVLLGGVAWAAGNYPTREEWDASRNVQGAKMDRVKADVSKMQIEQVKLRGAMDSIEKSQTRSEETQKDINRKLDRALNGTRRR